MRKQAKHTHFDDLAAFVACQRYPKALRMAECTFASDGSCAVEEPMSPRGHGSQSKVLLRGTCKICIEVCRNVCLGRAERYACLSKFCTGGIMSCVFSIDEVCG